MENKGSIFRRNKKIVKLIMEDYLLILIIVVIIWFVYTYIKNTSSFGNQTDTVNYVYSLYFDRFKNRFHSNRLSGRLHGVDMVYAIAMPQRREYINSQLNTIGVNAKVFDAVTPGDLSIAEVDFLSDINNVTSYIYNKQTRLSVLLSFMMCYIDSIVNNYQTIVVFEDDITIDISYDILNASTAEFNESNCDFFYMGYCFLDCKQKMDSTTYDYLKVLTNQSFVCGHATCIKTSALPALINASFPMLKPSDEIFMQYYKENNIKICIPKNEPFFNQQDRSITSSLNESTNTLRTCN